MIRRSDITLKKCQRCDGSGQVEIDSLCDRGCGLETVFEFVLCQICGGTGKEPELDDEADDG